MKITCDIIQDLLPLYADDVLSDDSKELVKEHLAECESCSKSLNLALTMSVPSEGVDTSKPLRKIKKAAEAKRHHRPDRGCLCPANLRRHRLLRIL